MENEKSNKYAQKAFTLTELLIVVVVVGVLAAVAMPKFNRVIETRRTVEAEELISAVRTEQEKRCTFDKPYAESFAKLPGVISVNNPDKNKTRTASQNYTYYLDNSGMYASSRNKDYQIKMQSYAAGGLCCEGAYCSSLNKSYPPCGAVPIDGCAAEIPGCQNPVYAGKPENACECDPNSCHCRSFASSNPCVCGKECSAGDVATQACTSGCGTQKRSCNSSCRWLANWDTSGCSSPSGPSCSCSDVGKCGSASGSASCDGGRCDYSKCMSCNPNACSVEGSKQTRPMPGDECRLQELVCANGNWEWRGGGVLYNPACGGECRDGQSCGKCGYRKCIMGRWGECEGDEDCGDECQGDQWDTQSCPDSCGSLHRDCYKGYWGAWYGECRYDCSWSEGGGSNESTEGNECSSGKTASCGTCGTKTCSKGFWGSCQGDSNCGASSCSNGATQGSQKCNGCGDQTTEKCENGKWKPSLAICSKTVEQCTVKPECSNGDTKGSQGCNSCGTQTTHKCENGKWKPSLGTCSKTAAQCATPPPGQCNNTCKPGYTMTSEAGCCRGDCSIPSNCAAYGGANKCVHCGSCYEPC